MKNDKPKTYKFHKFLIQIANMEDSKPNIYESKQKFEREKKKMRAHLVNGASKARQWRREREASRI